MNNRMTVASWLGGCAGIVTLMGAVLMWLPVQGVNIGAGVVLMVAAAASLATIVVLLAARGGRGGRVSSGAFLCGMMGAVCGVAGIVALVVAVGVSLGQGSMAATVGWIVAFVLVPAVAFLGLGASLWRIARSGH